MHLFMEDDHDKARNSELLLLDFEQMSGLKINSHKSEFFCFGEVKEADTQYADLIDCAQGQFPIKYLRILIRYRPLTNTE